MSESDTTRGQSNGNTAPASSPHGAPVPSLPPSPALTTPHERPRPPPNRRRDKPQLSCNSCRRRKARCDRQQPCNTCLSRGLALSCAYNPEAPTPQGTSPTILGSVKRSSTDRPRTAIQDRVQELERLVVTLMQQQQQQQQQQQHAPRLAQPSAASSFGFPVSSHLTVSAAYASPLNPQPPPALPPLQEPATAPSVDLGRISSDGISYVGDAHWAAVLDSIAELKEHLDADDSHTLVPSDEEESADAPAPQPRQSRNPGPMLLYGCPTRASHDDILASIPSRPVVDRLISKYFNALDMAPALLHSGQFLSQYERFWEDPPAIPIVWVGLLFTMMCLATQAQHDQAHAAGPDMSMTVKLFRERAVQCLVMGGYTKAGPFVLETLILYLTIELYLCEDAEFGIYLLLGIIVHLAMRMGYHRDPKHFSDISPFEGEIRRRIWATIYQVDLGISAQMGLPRMIKERQMDTELPRNLLDSDFGESTGELPPSRPDTDVTPMLYVLAKNRLASIGGAICDLVTDIQPFPYEEVMRIDQSLHQARLSLPPSLAWRPLAQSITCSAQVILQRIWLDVYLLRLQIILHKRHCFAPAHRGQSEPYPYSEQACLDAAIKILEYQALIDDETQSPDGQLYQVRWKMSSLFNYHFLLATSILCSFIRGDGSNKLTSKTLDSVGGDGKLRQLLTRSLDVWLRSSASSQEARKAAKALRLILRGTDASLTSAAGTPFSETSTTPGLPPAGFDWAHDPTLVTGYMSNMGFPFTMLTSMTTDTDMSGLNGAGGFDMTGADNYY